MEDVRRFQDVVGHEELIGHLQTAIQSEKISHAYILGGEQGAGKKMLANLFAIALQCTDLQDNADGTMKAEPCGACISCKKAWNQNHPDIIHISPEKPNSLGIDTIREQLINDVQIRPYESKWKIYIINEAQKMTLQAQNALLKTIEEPPAYAVILLLADNPDAFLPTISSRCVKLYLKPVEDQRVKDYLSGNLDVTESEADIQAAFARGNIGRARELSASEAFHELIDNAMMLLRQSRKMDKCDWIDAIKSMSAEKQNIRQYLEIFTIWFRDVLLFKATKEVDHLVFRGQLNHIKERAQTSSYEGLETIIQSITTAEKRLNANVNFDLVMELLFLTMREN